MISRFSDERGVAMVTALLVSLVVLALSLTVVTLSIHNSGTSSFDRKRIQAVGAAEAGIDAWFSGLTKATGSQTCSSTAWDGTLPTTPGSSYDVTVTLYSTWPPAPGTEIACTDPLPAVPLGALVSSKGTAVITGVPTAVSRTMQSEVKITPLYGGFNKAIFSNTVLNVQNKLTLNGYQANDGDIYTNGNLTLRNNTTIAGSAYSQGFVDIAQGIVKADAWGNSYVLLSNGIEVFGNATSSTSYVNLSSNSIVDGNAKAGTTITGGTIKGTKTPNSPSGPPPQTALPQLSFDQQAWEDPDGDPATTEDDYTVVSYADCTLAKTFISTILTGNYVVRISPACALSWGNNSVVNIHGNLAIVTDGSISTVNQTTWNAVGGKWTVFFIRPYQTGLNCTKPSPYDISISNNSNFSTALTLFAYSPCNIDFGNNNAGGVNGQIIGGTVTITNQMTMNYVPVLVPGFNLLGYNVQPSYVREVANG